MRLLSCTPLMGHALEILDFSCKHQVLHYMQIMGGFNIALFPTSKCVRRSAFQVLSLA